jgi:glucokinase
MGYQAGDRLEREILVETVELLTVWLGNVVDLLDPDVIIIGGGVALMLSPFFQDLQASYRSGALIPACETFRCAWRVMA